MSSKSTVTPMVATVKYEIVKKLGEVEIRHYSSIVIARGDGYGLGASGVPYPKMT